MIDFLRANPWCSQEEYKWGMSVAQIRLSGADFSRVEYLKDSAKKSSAAKPSAKKLNDATVVRSAKDLLNDLGMPVVR